MEDLYCWFDSNSVIYMSDFRCFEAYPCLFRNVTSVICMTVAFQHFDLRVDGVVVLVSLVQAIDRKIIQQT